MKASSGAGRMGGGWKRPGTGGEAHAEVDINAGLRDVDIEWNVGYVCVTPHRVRRLLTAPDADFTRRIERTLDESTTTRADLARTAGEAVDGSRTNPMRATE